MQTKRGIAVWLCMMGLVASCGAATSAEEPALSSTQESLIPPCTTSYFIAYYTDATYSTWSGSDYCDCGDIRRQPGTKTPYSIVHDPPRPCP
ncbi:hypothetical protein SAMN05443572_1021014 [Myxococcus fulvus]|uniref:Lipoprotein n=1 Tax=Myxococcus fulvus TaxID=33 RepID=A0A511SVD5_MYXFU|nr:hypothetical protein [Myxococcus fulvus]GEN05866.1 hypothetical protein MFU01_09030 [Myxococcus fulvus]SET65040.1 hypothetical protein SAMN05443572_1021014 [Myxococcus fulvus]